MPKRSLAPPSDYHLELGAEGTHAFFVVGLSTVNRIEVASIYVDRVVFRVVYPERSYQFAFRFGRPCIYHQPFLQKIRLSAETYTILYRLADALMRAYLAGVQPAYRMPADKGHFWLNGGERFQIASVRKSTFSVNVQDDAFVFARRSGQYFVRGSIERLSDRLRSFLFGFGALLMDAYLPYERVEGKPLEPLALYPDLEKEPPKKKRRMRMSEKERELERLSKPAKSVPKKRLVPPVSGSLF